MAAVEYDSSSEKSSGLEVQSDIQAFRRKRQKTSESSLENLKLGENPGDEQTAQVRSEKSS